MKNSSFARLCKGTKGSKWSRPSAESEDSGLAGPMIGNMRPRCPKDLANGEGPRCARSRADAAEPSRPKECSNRKGSRCMLSEMKAERPGRARAEIGVGGPRWPEDLKSSMGPRCAGSGTGTGGPSWAELWGGSVRSGAGCVRGWQWWAQPGKGHGGWRRALTNEAPGQGGWAEAQGVRHWHGGLHLRGGSQGTGGV